ncbi:hypothetical protein WDW37_21510 [Bdellovibrionota bacterium FG-1]
MNHKCFMGLLGVVATVASMGAQADNMIEINPAAAAAGVQVSIGQCPCFRWTIQAKVGQGRIETKDIWISIDGLLQYSQASSSDFSKLGSRKLTIGAAEALIKGAHVGLRFDGVTFGSEGDRGYSSILRTGVAILANIVQTDAVKLNLRTGYDFEKLTTEANQSATRHLLTETAEIDWTAGSFTGRATARVGMEPEYGFDPHHFVLGTSAEVRTRIVSFSDFELGASAQASVDYDPFRDLLGLNPINAVGMLLMDLTWARRSMSND